LALKGWGLLYFAVWIWFADIWTAAIPPTPSRPSAEATIISALKVFMRCRASWLDPGLGSPQCWRDIAGKSLRAFASEGATFRPVRIRAVRQTGNERSASSCEETDLDRRAIRPSTDNRGISGWRVTGVIRQNAEWTFVHPRGLSCHPVKRNFQSRYRIWSVQKRSRRCSDLFRVANSSFEMPPTCSTVLTCF
jgi:hypothetical protein